MTNLPSAAHLFLKTVEYYKLYVSVCAPQFSIQKSVMLRKRVLKMKNALFLKKRHFVRKFWENPNTRKFIFLEFSENRFDADTLLTTLGLCIYGGGCLWRSRIFEKSEYSVFGFSLRLPATGGIA